MLAQNPQQSPRRSRSAVRPPKKSAAAQSAALRLAAPPGKNPPPRRSSSGKHKKRAALGALFSDYCKNHIFLGGVPKRTPLSPPGFFNPLRCFSLRRACPTQPRREDFRTPQAPPPNRRLCGLPHRRGKIRRPTAVLPKTKKRATLGAPLTIVAKTIFWSAFQSVPRFLRRAFLTPCGAFLCGGLAPRSHAGRTSAPRKPRRPIGGGVPLPPRRGKIRRPAAVLPETKKRATLGALLNDYCKNHIFLGGVPKHTPPSPPDFFNPLRCFSLRQACPTQPRRENFRTPQAPPPNRRLCGLPHRRGKIRRPAGELSPKNKKKSAFAGFL